MIFFINGEHKKTFVYLFEFLLKKKTLEDHAKKFNVSKEYSLALLKELKMRTRANLMSRVVYLGTLYTFYATSIWMSFRKGVDKRIIFFSVLPSAFFGIFGISHFYFFLSVSAFAGNPSCEEVFLNENFFLKYSGCHQQLHNLLWLSNRSTGPAFRRTAKGLPKEKQEMVRGFDLSFQPYSARFQRCPTAFQSQHNDVDARYSLKSDFFRLTFLTYLSSYLSAFYATFAIFPFCLLISEKMYTHGLLPHFVLNTVFLLIPLFTSNEKFTNAVNRYSASVHFYLKFQNQLQIKNKMAHVFIINNRDQPVIFSFFHLFDFTSHFALIVSYG